MKKIFFLLLTFAAIYSMNQKKAKNRKSGREKRKSITIQVPDIVHDEDLSLTQRDRTMSMMFSGDDQVKQMLENNDEVEFVRVVLHYKLNCNIIDRRKENLFHWLVKQRSLGLLQFVCNWDQITADINQENRNKQTPLHFACALKSADEATQAKKIEIIKLLCKNGAKWEIGDRNGTQPLSYLTKPELRKLRDSLCTFENSDNEACAQKIELINYLCEKGYLYEKGENIFHWFVKNKSLELLQFACNWDQITGDDNQKNGAINQKNRNKQTPLHLACALKSADEATQAQKIEVIKLLCKNGAKWDTGDRNGTQPLSYLTEPELRKLRDSLCTFENSDNEACAQKIELINYLCKNGYLYENGVNWERGDNNGKQPLSYVTKSELKKARRKRKTRKKEK